MFHKIVNNEVCHEIPKITFIFLIVILALNSCKKDKGTDIDIVEYNKIIINLDKGIYKPEESAHLTIINNSKKIWFC